MNKISPISVSNLLPLIKPSLVPLKILLGAPLPIPPPLLNHPIPKYSLWGVMATGVEAEEGGAEVVVVVIVVLEKVIEIRTSSSTLQLLETVSRH